MKITNSLPKITERKKKRVGHGIGSGKGGHTSGRGQKGQKTRGNIGLTFEGTKIKKSLLKRLPLQRGRGKFKITSLKPIIINIKYLNVFAKGDKVDLQSLIKMGIVNSEDSKKYGVKILGDGEISTSLTVNLPCSKGAKAKIEKAGGKVAEAKG